MYVSDSKLFSLFIRNSLLLIQLCFGRTFFLSLVSGEKTEQGNAH